MEEAVWGVIYFLLAGLTGTGYVIYYIMRTAYIEMSDDQINSSNSSVDISSAG